MQTIHPHSPRALLVLGAALLCLLVLLISAAHLGSATLGGGGSQVGGSHVTATSVTTSHAVRRAVWTNPFASLNRVVVPWTPASGVGH